MFEKDLPGANAAGFNTTHISALPLETAETVAESWGFRITDQSVKSLDRLVRYVVGAAGRGANFLLNIGPRPDGRMHPRESGEGTAQPHTREAPHLPVHSHPFLK